MPRVVLSRRAERDLRRIGPGETFRRIRSGLEALTGKSSSMDVRPLSGAEPWLRLRVGDHRVLYRPIDPDEPGGVDADILVARVVHRSDLERAVATLK